MNWQLYLNFILALLALINPVTRLPLWKEMTGDEDPTTRKNIALYVTLTATLILLIFLVAGKPLLNFFSVDLSVFKISGGILLLISGISMVNGSIASLEDRNEEGAPAEKAQQRFRKVIVPLAFPVLAGPGSITTAILYGSKASGWVDYVLLSAVIVVIMAILLITLSVSNLAEKRVNDLFFTVLIRIFGIIVVAIGVQFMVEGLGEVFPAWLNESGTSDIKDNIQHEDGSSP